MQEKTVFSLILASLRGQFLDPPAAGQYEKLNPLEGSPLLHPWIPTEAYELSGY